MFHNFYQKNQLVKLQNNGFGLIELLVSFSILTLVLGTIMVRQDSFNSAVLLRNQAYEIALHAREVQMYAVSILGNSGDYNDVYGLNFNNNVASKNFYKSYRDTGTNFYYEAAEEFGAQGKLDPRFEIGEIRAIDSDGNLLSSEDNVSVIFQRPNFDARFFDNNSEISNASALEIRVVLKSDTSKFRTIEITKTGQISVQD